MYWLLQMIPYLGKGYNTRYIYIYIYYIFIESKSIIQYSMALYKVKHGEYNHCKYIMKAGHSMQVWKNESLVEFWTGLLNPPCEFLLVADSIDKVHSNGMTEYQVFFSASTKYF